MLSIIGRLRAGAKFFTLGLALGLLLAPHAGERTRAYLRERIKGAIPGVRHDA
jgi:hypothetical protein